jgi:hypothetical protein
MTQLKTTPEIVDHYLRQIRDIVTGLLGKVIEANNLPDVPTTGSQLALVPVYEEGFKESLLSLANVKATTTLQWPSTPQLDYLQAYYRRFRGENNRMRNEIVVVASNYCWARFYATKELIHCFTDEDGYPASGSVELVNDLIESLAMGGFARQPNCKPQTVVDEMAWYGATLYLVPTKWIPAIRRLQEQLEAEFKDGNSFLHLAQILRVPELVLRHRLRFDKV